MHISDGVLCGPVLGAGAAVAAAGVAIGLRKMDDDDMVKVAVLSSAFFVASLIHVPVGPASAHLVLNGLAGLLLGWAVFPAILVALVLQAVFFGHGGLTALGVNTATMAVPGVFCHYAFNRAVRNTEGVYPIMLGFAAGALAVVLAGLLVGAALLASGKGFALMAKAIVMAHIPVAIAEGAVTGSAVAFLRKVRPELLNPPGRPSSGEERSHA